jgi:succinate dehydrogenase/fumarate reductase flavoprotein subunit
MVTYDGFLCAETLKDQEVHQKPLGRLISTEVESEVERIQGLRQAMPSGGLTPMNLKRQIREVMSDKMNIVKTEEGMKEGLNEIHRIRAEDVPRMGLSNLTTRMNYGWMDALDVFNLLDVAELTIRSSLNRKESRGPFYRTDHPYTDNSNWHVKNIVFKDESGEDKFRLENYENIYLPPEFSREDYFKVAW